MFSVTVEYAFRAVVDLARLPPGEALSGQQLAERTGISRNYLAKILGTLRNAGLLSSSPGIGGGYWLAKPPAEIPLIDIVRILDGQASLPQCLLHHGRACSDDDPCSAHALWSGVRERYLSFLESTSVAAISQAVGTDPPAADSSPDTPAARG